ncbi:MAG: lipopolysaccharide kinase InaA family protein [Thermodesulfobacteriota bacterium]|nr:lipopolysaccharide kinase InaA family protein [Thermodesulfobacteriota bacterium]
MTKKTIGDRHYLSLSSIHPDRESALHQTQWRCVVLGMTVSFTGVLFPLYHDLHIMANLMCRVYVQSASGIPETWAHEIWAQVAARSSKASKWKWTTPLPSEVGKGEAVVKVYQRRAKHGVLRRLRHGRAAQEWRGYQIFQTMGVPTIRCLFFAEERCFGLLEKGILVTVRAPNPNVAESFLRDQDPALLEATADELGLIHHLGLAHGDPRMSNFLATPPHPLALDLSSWSRLNRRSQTTDLTRLLGSITALTQSDKALPHLIECYQAEGLMLPIPAKKLLEYAVNYASVKQRP